jgi:hypothetical protein
MMRDTMMVMNQVRPVRHSIMMKALVMVVTLMVSDPSPGSFLASALVPPNTRTAATGPSLTSLYGIADRIPLVGRFRRKKEVQQVPQIKAGDTVPRDVDVIPSGTDGTPTQVHEVLSSKSIIVGTYRKVANCGGHRIKAII